jgi:hypothetical protein
MNKLSLITAILSSFIGFNANAYQTEVNGSYEHTEIEEGKINTVTLSGQYYFNPVETRNAPLAEAAFLDKASNLGLGYSYSKIKDDDEDLVDFQFNTLGLESEIFIPDSQFYVSGALHRTNVKATVHGLGSESDNGNGYEFEAGFLPINGLLFAVGVADFSESMNPVKIAKYGFVTNFSNAAVVSGENDDTAVSLRAKYVSEIGGYYTNFEAQTYIGDETTYRLGADLYLDPTLSIGLSFADSTADDSDSIFNIRAQKFITSQFALGVGYTTVEDVDSYGINGTFRF